MQKNKGFIFLLSCFLAYLNIFWNKNIFFFKQDLKSLFFVFFSFFTYFLIFYIFNLLLLILNYKLPLTFTLIFFFFNFSSFQKDFFHNFLFFFILILFLLLILTSNLLENIYSLKFENSFYPIFFVFSFIYSFFQKKIEFSSNEIIFNFFFVFYFFVSIIFISFLKHLKISPNIFLPSISIILIFYIISFFYFFPFTPPPVERKGQNFILITIEGLRADSIEYMDYLKNFSENSTFFQNFYLYSPSSEKNIEKILFQKEKLLLDFFPQKYVRYAQVQDNLKEKKVLEFFNTKVFHTQKSIYENVLENWIFLKFLKKKEGLKLKNIFEKAHENLRNINKPFFSWINVDNLLKSIPESLKIEYLEGKKIEKEVLKDLYRKGILDLDFHLGYFIESLKKEKWFSKTNILILGVSGFELMEHGRIGDGTSFYEESIKTFFIWNGPNIPRKKIDYPFSILDIFPTILKRFNLSDDYKSFEGIEFSKAFENVFPLERVFTFGEIKYYLNGKAYIKEDKKLILKKDGDNEFYDLKLDPFEKNNLIYSKDDKIIKIIKEMEGL